ncbi:hypothetical protein H0264_35535 [Nocardia huaxiensis]|uniref:Uncharacterized protein n=1 Tax=Nocardia huaxiensis TaxID=2755382 RepID=A0A7D6VBK0_9NOCA|nr:hypothetical protein [Nocardia huaxiensis]QLY30382.1 hypothetical protein H0264_35535 [Nocardia huaxiensis]
MMSQSTERIGRLAWLGMLCALVVLATGCTVPGTPQETTVDLNTLSVGDYGTDLLDEPPPGDGRYGKIVEAVRMGEAIIDPAEADPDAKYSLGVGIAALPSSDLATRRLGDAVKPVLDQQRMLTGFWVGGTDTDDDSAQVGMHRVSVVLLRFPDDATAQAAATGIDAADFAVSKDNVAVSIPGYGAARGHWRPSVPTLAATIAHGSFVVNVYAQWPSTDLAALTGVVRKAFDAQLPALDRFAATPVDRISALALDRDGMLRRTLPAKRGQWPYPVQSSVPVSTIANWDDPIVDSGVVFGPRVVFLKYARPDAGTLVADAFAKVAWAGVLRFTDPVAARKYFAPIPKESDYRVTTPPPGVPDVRCTESADPGVTADLKYSCKVLVHRYVGVVNSRDLQDAQEKAAAQYVLLVKADRP